MTRHDLEEDGIFDWNQAQMAAKDPIGKVSKYGPLNSIDSKNVIENGNQISGVLFTYNIDYILTIIECEKEYN